MKNYRPNNLLNCIVKLFTRIITDIIKEILFENQSREQAGFTKGYSTLDHLHTLNQLIEKTSDYNMPLVLPFVDYKTAFDSLETAAVITSIKQQGINPIYIITLQHIYNNSKSYIKLHTDSDPFRLMKGVHQGDTI